MLRYVVGQVTKTNIMKKVIFAAAIITGCLWFKPANAQVRFSLNIGSQPEWGPTGYDHADYYYLPDIGVYYDVPTHEYIYRSNGAWVRRRELPQRWSNYDLYHGYKVVLNQPRPWRHDADIRAKYAGYRGHHDQAIIRDSHEDKYRNHWHDNGRHEGRGRHNGEHGHGHD
jgi:hypothetical protein